MSESKVQVAVRIRPLLGKEKIERCTTCVEVLSDCELLMGGDKQFTFDHVFGIESDQESVYSKCVAALVENLFDGYNATVLAYGQTGSGKTFTMGSGCAASDALNPLAEKDRGVIPRATAQIFDLISRKRISCPGAEFYLRVQFLELYGENLRDLLDPVGTAQGKQVAIRDGPNDTLQVVGASEETVKSPQDMLALLERGTLCRTTGSTDMNTHSSRSHAIFTIVLEQQLKPSQTGDGEEGDIEYRTAKFHFVDLAGSERAKRTGATGQRMREGININMGLLALGNVISALGSEDASTPKFVPYRDSKLTRMLQDSLGGNSRTLMIACVSPADVNFEETLNALRYANRARNIKNRAIVNRDPASSQIAALKAQIAQLKLQIANGGNNAALDDGEPGEAQDRQSDYKSKCLMLEVEVARLVESLESETRARLELENRFAVLEAERMVLLGGSDASSLDEDEVDPLLGDKDISKIDDGEEDEENTTKKEDAETQQGPTGEEEEEEDHNAKMLKQKFHRSQKALKKLFSTYDETLRSKEAAMKQIMEERAKFEALKAHFESKMAEMNEEVKETQAQREVLEQKLKELESEHQQTDFSRSEAQRLRGQMAEKDKRLKELEDRTRQLNEARKAAAEWQKKESVVRTEIEHVKREKVELQRRMTENHKKHMEELRERQLEIAGLKRERARLAQGTNELTAQKERDSKVIQHKSEQIAAMQRKLREAQRLGQLPRQLSERDKTQRKQIEELAARDLKREEEMQNLRRLLAKKEEAIAKRDEVNAQKDKLIREKDALLRRQGVAPGNNVALHPEVASEDLRELEQRLEALNSEIMFRDRQCRDVLEKEDDAEGAEPSVTAEGGADEPAILKLSTLDQAKDVCRILMQMFVESKKELRSKQMELERFRRQVIHQDQAARLERRRTETLLLNGQGSLNGSSPVRLHHRVLGSEEEEGLHMFATETGPSTASKAQGNGATGPTTPAKVPGSSSEGTEGTSASRSQQLVASEVRIRKIEAKLRSLRVDDDNPSADVADSSMLNGSMSMANVGAGNAGRRTNAVPVWDRLTSPSAATGIHKYGVQVLRRTSVATQPIPAQDEEECIDEIIKVLPGRRQNRASILKPDAVTADGAPVSMTGDSDNGKFAAKIEAMFAQAYPAEKTDGSMAEKPKAPAAGWERVATQFTESYETKRKLDAEARKSAGGSGAVGGPAGAFVLRGRQTSPTRRAPPPPLAGANSVPGKENSSSGSRAVTFPAGQQQSVSVNDLRRLRKEHFASERARRRKHGLSTGADIEVTVAVPSSRAPISERDQAEEEKTLSSGDNGVVDQPSQQQQATEAM